ncbi:MAG: hypothetical protein HOV79_21315 [Hamadaea sp.]|nr:hypothetical protein [Hamadaea sp.]
MEPAPNRRRKIATVVLTGCLAVAAVAGLGQGLASCSSPKAAPETKPRPLNAVEAGKLAEFRLHNHEDGRAAVRGVVGSRDEEIAFRGWVDWRRPLVYLRTAGRKGEPGLLLQAVPGVIAIRAETATPAEGAAAPPPARPPAGNWRVRPLGLPMPDAPDPMDALIGLILTAAATEADNPDLLRGLQTQWLRHDALDGTAVEVLLGPAVMPTAAPSPSGSAAASPTELHYNQALEPVRVPSSASPTRPAPTPTTKTTPTAKATASPSPRPDPNSLLAHGGPVAYWLDGGARLRRLEVMLTDKFRARVDFDRSQRPELTAVEAFGGAAVNPRPVSAVEAKALAMMRQRTLAARGGRLTVSLALPPARMISVTGWVDWRAAVAYAKVNDLDDASRNLLVHAGRSSVSLRTAAKGRPTPPLPAPRGGWETRRWTAVGLGVHVSELDILLHEVLSMAAPGRDSASDLAKRAHRLRLDEVGGRPVAVFEIHSPGEQGTAPGTALMRYWVDPTGVVRRIEMRTRLGFAQLDLDLSKRPPTLPGRV